MNLVVSGQKGRNAMAFTSRQERSLAPSLIILFGINGSLISIAGGDPQRNIWVSRETPGGWLHWSPVCCRRGRNSSIAGGPHH